MLKEKEIENTAKPVALFLKDEDVPCVQKDLEQMLEFCRLVCDYDVQEDNSTLLCDATPLREDFAEKSYPVQDITNNAPLHKDGYILLRKSE